MGFRRPDGILVNGLARAYMRKMTRITDMQPIAADQPPPSIRPTPPRPQPPAPTPEKPKEIGGPAGPEPTRYGDWEVKGRCSDF
jgi:hypothetical protein